MRSVPVSQLLPHESAWATTVHKSQGSEFTAVLLVLLETAGEMLTRAHERVTVVGSSSTVRASAGWASFQQVSFVPQLTALVGAGWEAMA